MKRFIVPLLLVAAVVSIVFAGCVPGAAPPETPPAAPPEAPPTLANPYEGLALKPDGTPYTIATAHVFTGNDWCITAAGIAKSLILRTGAEYSFCDANLDTSIQIAYVEDLIATHGADILLIQPVDEMMQVVSVDQAEAAGIHVFCIGTWMETESMIPDVYFDFVGDKTGRGANLLGEFFIQKALETGRHMTVFELWGDHTLDTALRRNAGFHRATDERPDVVTVIESADTHWSDDVCADFIIDALTTRPEINGFYSHGTGTGAIEGLRGVDRVLPRDNPDHVWSSTIDCETLVVQYMQRDEFDAFANHSPWPIYDIALKLALWEVVLGQPVTEEIAIPITVITPENFYTATFGGASVTYQGLPPRDWDKWPVLDFEEELGIVTPTVEIRRQLLGY